MKDYWTFTPILRSFMGTGYGNVCEIEGLWWRIRGSDYVLLTPPQSDFRLPSRANPFRVRSLVWANSLGRIVPSRPAGYTFSAPLGWSPPLGLVRVLRRGDKESLKVCIPSPFGLVTLLDVWVKEKKAHKPSSMVVRGHYRAMINDRDMQFVGYMSREGGLVAAIGYALDAETGQAVIGFAKHVYGTWWLARYVWARTIAYLLSQGARGVVCGDTADGLKRELGLVATRQRRVDFSSFRDPSWVLFR